MTNLSVIIPFYERLDDLMRCYNSLGASQTGTVELVIQDDASPSVTLDNIVPPVFERNPVNMGFAATCNAGAKRAHGNILGFVNQDILATPQWTRAGWDAMLLSVFDDPRVGIVAPRLLFPDGSVQSVGGTFDQRSQPVHRCLAYSQPDVLPETSTRQEVDWVTGAALFIRRELFEQVGGFDLRYSPSYFEDVDLCLKVRALGYAVIVEPAVTFIHKVGSTGGSPHFLRSALRFKELWVDSGLIQPGQVLATQRYW